MSRISIDVTPHQHRQLKAVAALAGQSLKDYLLFRAIPREDDLGASSMQELEAFLDSRLEAGLAGNVSKRSVSDIWQAVKKSAS